MRRALWAVGLRYRLHDKRLPGRPDLVLTRQRTAVFVHGCFWHWHEGCVNFRIPKTRPSWWERKLADNRARDKKVGAELKALGWRPVVIWECDAADPERLLAFADSLRGKASR